MIRYESGFKRVGDSKGQFLTSKTTQIPVVPNDNKLEETVPIRTITLQGVDVETNRH